MMTKRSKIGCWLHVSGHEFDLWPSDVQIPPAHLCPQLFPDAPTVYIWWNSPKQFAKSRANELYGVKRTDGQPENIMRPAPIGGRGLEVYSFKITAGASARPEVLSKVKHLQFVLIWWRHNLDFRSAETPDIRVMTCQVVVLHDDENPLIPLGVTCRARKLLGVGL